LSAIWVERNMQSTTCSLAGDGPVFRGSMENLQFRKNWIPRKFHAPMPRGRILNVLFYVLILTVKPMTDFDLSKASSTWHPDILFKFFLKLVGNGLPLGTSGVGW